MVIHRLPFMRTLLPAFLSFLIMAGCNTNSPDLSAIKVNTSIGRFDKQLFEKTDTTDMAQGVRDLQTAFPYFTNDFINNIIGLPPLTGAINDSVKSFTLSELKRFIQNTKPLYDSVSKKFANISWLEKELNNSFKYLHYYFPDYILPKIVAYVGPFNAPGIAVTDDAIAIGLQLYAGRDFAFYTSSQGRELFPLYISRTFEPEYITVNCMRAIELDIYSGNNRGGPLIEQMIEKGKQWWLLQQFMPDAPDSIITGYTSAQLKWCNDNEGLIWNFFLQNNYLYSAEYDIIKNYIGEAPFTQGMPDSSPGNIGQWVGWMIVKKYLSKKPGTDPDMLMKTGYQQLFSASKYKPR